MKTVKIQVMFTQATEYGDFTDALYFSPAEYEALTDEQLTTMQNERVANYVQSIKDSMVVTEPTVEDLQAQQEAIDKQIEQLTNTKENLSSQITDLTDNNPIE